MEVIGSIEACPRPPAGTAVTIGAYDGVHLGHRAVIAEVRRLAAADGRDLKTAVVTFDRHPASVVRPKSAPKLLTDLDQKLELLAATGLDYAVVVRFDAERSREPAEDFVTQVLVDCLRARTVVVGKDFHFGHQRRGNVELLRAMGATLGFDVAGLDLVRMDGRPAEAKPTPPARPPSPLRNHTVSSTAIRQSLADGDLLAANELLGRPHEVRGTVETGDRRGRELGFPTANVSVPEAVALPADGIYAGWYERPDGSVHSTAISLGRRPTFYEKAKASLLEAHLLDFEGDLYGEPARVRFVARLRGEERYESVEALVEQMERDCRKAREVLGPKSNV